MQISIYVQKIYDESVKKIYFLSNIVGIRCFDNYLISRIDNLLLNIKCYKLYIPNNIKKLIEQAYLFIGNLCDDKEEK